MSFITGRVSNFQNGNGLYANTSDFGGAALNPGSISTQLKGANVGTGITTLNWRPGTGANAMVGGVTVTGAGPGTGNVSLFDPADRVYFGTGTSTSNGGTGSITIGVGAATVGSNRGVAIGSQDINGQNATSQANDCVVVGPGSFATPNAARSVVIGVTSPNGPGFQRNVCDASEGVVIGTANIVGGGSQRAVVIGANCVLGANSSSSILMGEGAAIGANAPGCVALCPLGGISGGGDRSTCIGLATSVTAPNCVCIGSSSGGGNSCFATAANSIAIGPGARAPFANSVVIGQDIASFDPEQVIIGDGNGGGNVSAIMIGTSNTGGAAASVTIGKDCHSGENSVVIGQQADGQGFVGTIAIGLNASATSSDGVIAIGQGAITGGQNTLVVGGGNSLAGALNTTALGFNTTCGAPNSTCVGAFAGSAGDSSTLIGANANGAAEDFNTICGANSTSNGAARCAILGEHCTANIKSSLCLGWQAESDTFAGGKSPLAIVAGEGVDKVDMVDAAPIVQDHTLVLMVNGQRYKIPMMVF